MGRTRPPSRYIVICNRARLRCARAALILQPQFNTRAVSQKPSAPDQRTVRSERSDARSPSPPEQSLAA